MNNKYLITHNKKYNRVPNKLDYLLVLILIIFSGLGNGITRDVRYTIIPIVFAFIIVINKRIKISKSVVKVYLIFALYIFGYYIKYSGVFDPMFTYRIFSYITLSYLVVSIVKYNFFVIYETIIYHLALISVPLYIFTRINYGIIFQLLKRIETLLQIPSLKFGINNEYVNVWIYTINQNGIRNCGFTWEPGGFANFLVLALVISLAINKFKLKNRKTIVILIALLTTFTTTGYLSLIVIFLWYLYNVKFQKKLLLFPLGIILIIYLSTLPFMTEKIIKLSTNSSSFETISSLSTKTGYGYSLGRFTGLIMNIKDFIRHPIIGYGGHTELTLRGLYEIDVASINGIGNWMSKFGSIGFLLFVYSYLKSLKNLSLLYNFKKPIILFGVLLILGFSFNLIQSPLFFAFMLSYIYLPVSKNINYGKNNK